MVLSAQQIQIILGTIGSIKRPNFESVADRLSKRDEFDGIDITAPQIQAIHDMATKIGDRKEAIKVILDKFGDEQQSIYKKTEHRVEEVDSQRENISPREDKEMQSMSGELEFYKKIADYTVVRKKHNYELVQEVLEHMRKGWIPYGGVSFAAAGISPIGDTGNTFIQAMIKLRD